MTSVTPQFLRAVRRQHFRDGNTGKNRVHWKAFQMRQERDRGMYTMSVFRADTISNFEIKNRIEAGSSGKESEQIVALCLLSEIDLLDLEGASLLEDPDDPDHYEVVIPIPPETDEDFKTSLIIWAKFLLDTAFRNGYYFYP